MRTVALWAGFNLQLNTQTRTHIHRGNKPETDDKNIQTETMVMLPSHFLPCPLVFYEFVFVICVIFYLLIFHEFAFSSPIARLLVLLSIFPPLFFLALFSKPFLLNSLHLHLLSISISSPQLQFLFSFLLFFLISSFILHSTFLFYFLHLCMASTTPLIFFSHLLSFSSSHQSMLLSFTLLGFLSVFSLSLSLISPLHSSPYPFQFSFLPPSMLLLNLLSFP